MHDLERLRSAAGLPASLVTYFSNNGLNKNLGLVQCMEAVAEKVATNKVIAHVYSSILEVRRSRLLHCPFTEFPLRCLSNIKS